MQRAWLVDGKAQGPGPGYMLLPSVYMLHMCATVHEIDFDCKALSVHN